MITLLPEVISWLTGRYVCFFLVKWKWWWILMVQSTIYSPVFPSQSLSKHSPWTYSTLPQSLTKERRHQCKPSSCYSTTSLAGSKNVSYQPLERADCLRPESFWQGCVNEIISAAYEVGIFDVSVLFDGYFGIESFEAEKGTTTPLLCSFLHDMILFRVFSKLICPRRLYQIIKIMLSSSWFCKGPTKC